MRRLVDDGGITHAHHNGTIDSAIEHTTACGILFETYGLPNEGEESSLRRRFRVINRPGGSGGPVGLLGTPEAREVDCMSCLVRMRTWNQ
jgi:hypothetical protein